MKIMKQALNLFKKQSVNLKVIHFKVHNEILSMTKTVFFDIIYYFSSRL